MRTEFERMMWEIRQAKTNAREAWMISEMAGQPNPMEYEHTHGLFEHAESLFRAIWGAAQIAEGYGRRAIESGDAGNYADVSAACWRSEAALCAAKNSRDALAALRRYAFDMRELRKQEGLI